MQALWRITPTPPDSVDLSRLAAGLSLHLHYAPITTVLVQIGDRQQAYIAGEACPNCQGRRCDSSCLMQLLQRLLLGTHAASELRYLSLGLAERPYTRLALAIPRKGAWPLGARLLRDWREARLTLAWRTVAGRRVVGAALAVGADGPAPEAVLRQAGWRAIAAPLAPLRSSVLPAIPPTLPYGWAWGGQPDILLPALHEAASPGNDLEAQIGDTRHSVPSVAPAAVAVLSDGTIRCYLTPQNAQAFCAHLRAATVAVTEQAAEQQAAMAPPVAAEASSSAQPEHPIETSPPAGRRGRTSQGVIITPPPDVVPAAEDARGASAPAGESGSAGLGCEIDINAAFGATPDASTHESTRTRSERRRPGAANTRAAVPAESQVDVREGDVAAGEMPTAIRWVPGPADLSAREVAELLEQIVAHPRLTSGRGAGLAVSRLTKQLWLHQPVARALMVWLDLAGLLALPPNPRLPWDSPRPLTTLALPEIAAALCATPPPDKAAIAAAFQIAQQEAA